MSSMLACTTRELILFLFYFNFEGYNEISPTFSHLNMTLTLSSLRGGASLWLWQEVQHVTLKAWSYGVIQLSRGSAVML